MNRRRASLAVALVALLPLVAGCGANSKLGQRYNDAPTVGDPDTNAARIYAMPDGFTNVAIKCIPGTHSGIATAFHGDAPQPGGIFIFHDPDICK